MKTVKIKHYTENKNGYTVAIGNGITKDFVNKKHCLKFLADTNRFLTNKLHEVNFILSDLQVMYRRNWFYFDNLKSAAAEMYSLERICIFNLSGIEEKMDLLVSRSGYENGNHFVFSHFRSIFSLLIDTIKILQKLQLKKSSAVEVHKLEVLYIRVIQIEKELLFYDGTLSKEQLDADEIFTRNRMKAV